MRKNKFSKNFNPEHFFDAILGLLKEEVMVTNALGRIVYINDATAKNLGFSKKNILGKSVMLFFSPKISFSQWQKKYFIPLKKSQMPQNFIIQRFVKHKQMHTIDVSAVYLKKDGEEYILSIGQDITKQYAMQSQLKEAQEQHLLLSEQARDGIVTFDLTGKIVYANKAAQWLVNIPSVQKRGFYFKSFVAKESIDQALAIFSKVKKGLAVIGEEITLKAHDGTKIFVEITLSPIYKQGRIVQIHGVLRDVSRRKHEEDLILEAEKARSLRDVISGMTYELQYPLRGVFQFCQNLLDKYEGRHFEYIGFKEYKDIFAIITQMRDKAKHCFETTEKLLVLNKKKIGAQEKSSSVNQILKETIQLVRHQLDVSDIKVQWQLCERLPLASIGPMELGQVTFNVITNAIQSMTRGGVLTLKTSFQKDKGIIRIDCIDQGVGIPKEVLSRIFEPFFTTKERGPEKSSGLGLSIVHSIVKAFDGDIFIKSTEQKGTTVTILLPQY
ncbi:MAG TPA: PAS domain S-box protein [Candidatus Omnitrophota bacterium]|nr:PAS domain S-box protein [Candidatus Omnitrophota bacterium]